MSCGKSTCSCMNSWHSACGIIATRVAQALVLHLFCIQMCVHSNSNGPIGTGHSKELCASQNYYKLFCPSMGGYRINFIFQLIKYDINQLFFPSMDVFNRVLSSHPTAQVLNSFLRHFHHRLPNNTSSKK